MVSSVILLISLCVFAVHGQADYDHNSTEYVYDDATEMPSIDEDESDDDSFNWFEWFGDYMGERDVCDPNPCLNGGSCSNDTADGSFQCNCTGHFMGKNCHKVKNLCRDANCGRGDCLVTKTAPFFECMCKAPYLPPACRKAAPCKTNPCLNGGSCRKGRLRSSFLCDCPDQYSGKFCQVEPDDCYEGNGESYHGSVSETVLGHECLHWNSFFILDKGTDTSTEYEGFDGIGQHNYCRNPDGDSRPWCFVNNKDKLKWEYCDIRSCSDSVQPTPPTTHETDPIAEPEPTAPAEWSQCGKPKPGRASRIFGGKKSLPAAHPWQVSLQMKSPYDPESAFEHNCGGILIDSCWVLTAGHCIESGIKMQVQLGGVDVMKDEPYDQTIDVEEVIVHEEFKMTPNAAFNDIALLRLKGVDGHCANETRFVKKACLPSHMFATNTECVISGWGATEKKVYGSNQLLDAPVVIISQQRCNSNASYKGILDDSMFCAGNVKGVVDTCQGDSGGPLVCPQDGTYYVTGVTSWGEGCGVKNKPGVYANVAQFVDWISATMKQPPKPTPKHLTEEERVGEVEDLLS